MIFGRVTFMDEDRAEARRQLEAMPAPRRTPPPQCHCGRFYSPSTFRRRGPDLMGVTRYSWTCSRCGLTGDSS